MHRLHRRLDRARAGWLALAAVGLVQAALPVVPATLPEEVQARLDDNARRIAAMTDDERAALRASVVAWDALPAAERVRQREAWQAWKMLPEPERARMRAARAAFVQLPAERQQALRAQFDGLDAGVRRGWLLGPSLGADWPRLHALFAQVPVDERDDLLAALRMLSPQGRDALVMLAQRIPPEARAAFRAELLARPAGAREAWLLRRSQP